MRLLAAIEGADVAREILECLGLPGRGPPLAAPQGGAIEPDHGSRDEDSHWDFNPA